MTTNSDKKSPSVSAKDAVAVGKTRTRNREKTLEELNLAILRIKNKGIRLTISAVADEAGVSAGLIHNTYPDVAESIRKAVGKSTREQRDKMALELAEAKTRLKELTAEKDAAEADLTRIASLNETLRQENARLNSVAFGTVVMLPSRTPPA